MSVKLEGGSIKPLTAAHKSATHTELSVSTTGSVNAIGRHRRDRVRLCIPAAENQSWIFPDVAAPNSGENCARLTALSLRGAI